MAAGSAPENKQFILRDSSGGQMVGIIYRNQDDFVKKCKHKFKVKDDEEVIFIKPDSQIEVLVEDIFDECDGSYFIVKKEPKWQNEDSSNTRENTDDGKSDNNVSKHTNSEHGRSNTRENIDDRKSNINDSKHTNSGHGKDEKKEKYRVTKQRPVVDNDVSRSSDVVDDDEETEMLQKEYVIDTGPLKTHMENKGLRDIGEVVQEVIDQWKSTPVTIAVIGQSGKGKSTLINTMLGMRVGDQKHAKTGTEVTTMKPTPYRHPDRENFVMWDIPGVFWVSGNDKEDTDKEAEYMKEVKSINYDFFLIVFTERVHSNDIRTAEELIKRDKVVYFVRNKFDADLLGQMSAKPHHTEKEILETCRAGQAEAINEKWKLGHEIPPLFIISALSINMDRFDYQYMISMMYEAAADSKKDCFVLTIKSESKKMTEAKAVTLRRRCSVLSKLVIRAFSPSLCKVLLPKILPKNSIAVIDSILDCLDLKLVVQEIKFYKEQFGLDDASLTELAIRVGMNVADLKHESDLQSPLFIKSVADTEAYIRLNGEKLLSEKAEQAIDECIPRVGMFREFVSGVLTVAENSLCVYIIYKAIDHALVLMKEDACRIIDYIAEKTENDT